MFGSKIFKISQIEMLADKIYKGILAQRKEIVINWWFKLFILIIRLLPVNLTDKLKTLFYMKPIEKNK